MMVVDDLAMNPGKMVTGLLGPIGAFALAVASLSHAAFAVDTERNKTCAIIQTEDASEQTHCYTSRQAEIAHRHSEAFFEELGEVVATFPSREVLEQQVEAQEKRRELNRETSIFDMVVGE